MKSDKEVAAELRREAERFEARVLARGGGKTTAMLQEKQNMVRVAIFEGMSEFINREITPELRIDMQRKANQIASDAAKRVGIRKPRIVVDRGKQPNDIHIRIAFPLGGRQ